MKYVLIVSILLMLTACQKPFIKNTEKNQIKDAYTANQSFTRTGIQDFIFDDSLFVIGNESYRGLPYPTLLKYSNKLIFTTHNGYLYFSELQDIGQFIKANLTDAITTAPTIHGDMLFVAVNKGNEGLLAYDIKDGSILWETEGMLSQSSPVVFGDIVIHAGTYGKITAFNISDGSQQWQNELDDRILNNLALIDDKLIVATQNGIIRSYNVKNGVLNWSLDIDQSLYASPVVNRKHLFLALYNGNLLKIDIDSGSVIKKMALKKHIYQTPLLGQSIIYVGNAAGEVFAVDNNTLKTIWKVQLDGPVTNTFLLGRDEIIAGTASRYLYRLNTLSGVMIQRIKLEGRPKAQPVFFENKLYVAHEPDYIAVLSTRKDSK